MPWLSQDLLFDPAFLTHEREFVAIDVETTGLDPQRDCIIEIGAQRFNLKTRLLSFCSLVKPSLKLSPAITHLTGITPHDLEDQPEPAEILPQFLDFLGDRILLAHNALFDLKFINQALRQAGLRPLNNYVIDTIWLAKICLPPLKHYSLTKLLQALKLRAEGSHRALADAQACAAIFCKLVSQKINALPLFFNGREYRLDG